MKVKLGVLLNSFNHLKALSEFTEIDVMLSYKLAKMLNVVQKELDIFDQIRSTKIKSYNSQKGQDYVVPEDCLKDFTDEMQRLSDKEIELPIDIISVNELKSCKMSPKALMALEWLISGE